MKYIMAIGDGPFSGTGFGEELRHALFGMAQNGFEVHWQSGQHFGYPITITDRMFEDIPNKGGKIKIYSGTHGNPRNFGADSFYKNYRDINPELVLFMGDPKNLHAYIDLKLKLAFPFAMYVTLDGVPIHPQWIEYLKYVNVLIAMTEWAQNEYIQVGFHPAYIHHGIRWDYWHVTEEKRRKIRQDHMIDDDICVFINWDVPQHRKRTDALLRCWRDFIKRDESRKQKAILVLYSDWKMSATLGWNVESLIQQYNVPRDTIVSPLQIQGSPKFWSWAEPVSQLKQIACIGDIYTCTTSGEGFGKTKLEALTLGMPVVVTDYSACSEVCEKGSILVPCYEGRAGRFRMDDSRRSVEAGIVDEKKFVDAMEYLYEDENERRRLGREARRWAKNYDYDKYIIPAWKDLLGAIDTDIIAAKELLNL